MENDSSTMMMKKQRTSALAPVSRVDVTTGKVLLFDIRTLRAAPPMPGSLRITHAENLRLESGPTSLILLCDTSGSMQHGGRIVNLRRGVEHICGFMRQAQDMELTVIAFNDHPTVMQAPGGVPDEAAVHSLCEAMVPSGGTNIGAALETALRYAMPGRTLHVVLFTDGYDSCGLGNRLSAPLDPFLDSLSKHPLLTLHCVGICTDADARMLSSLSNIANTGTFQVIKDNQISGLMGSLWALMSEMVGVNGFATVSVDGVEALPATKFPLRVCHPPVPIRLPFVVPEGAVEVVAEIKIEDAVQTVRLALPRDDPDHIDSECALDAIADMQSKAAAKVAVALQDDNFDAAVALNAELVASIQAIGALFMDPEVADAVTSAVAELADQARAIEAARTNVAAARELELRNLSRASTERSNSLSINPNGGGRTMSDLQRDLSA